MELEKCVGSASIKDRRLIKQTDFFKWSHIFRNVHSQGGTYFVVSSSFDNFLEHFLFKTIVRFELVMRSKSLHTIDNPLKRADYCELQDYFLITSLLRLVTTHN